MPFGNHRLQKQVLNPIEVKGWRAPELMRVPLAREEYRHVRNNLLHAYRIERVLFKQALCPSIAKEKRCESIGVSF